MQSGAADRYDASTSIYRNNIVYKTSDIDAAGRSQIFVMDKLYTESNNTFDYWAESGSLFKWQLATDVTVTDDDFVSLDLSQLYLSRKADGSLPDITFGQLDSSSDLIDKGIQIPESDNSGITMQFLGNSPDIGYSEFNSALSVLDQPEESLVDFYFSKDKIVLLLNDKNIFTRYDLYSINGICIKSGLINLEYCEINTAKISPGIYVIVLSGSHTIQSKKVYVY
jgi:hypothetical protein